eukprot:6213243-Pleurochrysis_carterae.AAC.1
MDTSMVFGPGMASRAACSMGGAWALEWGTWALGWALLHTTPATSPTPGNISSAHHSTSRCPHQRWHAWVAWVGWPWLQRIFRWLPLKPKRNMSCSRCVCVLATCITSIAFPLFSQTVTRAESALTIFVWVARPGTTLHTACCASMEFSMAHTH